MSSAVHNLLAACYQAMRCDLDLDLLFGNCTVTVCVCCTLDLSRQEKVPWPPLICCPVRQWSLCFIRQLPLCLFLAFSRMVAQAASQSLHDVISLLQNNGPQLTTGAITFANNYALQPNAIDIPTRDVSVEFWARTPSATHSSNDHNALSDILDIASHTTSMCPLAMQQHFWQDMAPSLAYQAFPAPRSGGIYTASMSSDTL